MLDGFLTTALELIIILDVCGAIIYVVAVSLRRAKQKQAEQADAVPTTPGLAYGPTLSTATAAPLSAPPPPLPEWAQEAVSRHDAVTDVRFARCRNRFPPCHRRHDRNRTVTARNRSRPSASRWFGIRIPGQAAPTDRQHSPAPVRLDAKADLEAKTGSGKARTDRYRK